MKRYDNPSMALNMTECDDGEYIDADPVLTLLEAMFDAEEKDGCGFYSDKEWTKNYDALRNLLGREDSFIHFT